MAELILKSNSILGSITQIASIKTERTIYMLLGEQAADHYQTYGTKGLNNTDFDFSIIKITNGMTLFDLLESMDGYFGYSEITEKDYNKLSKFFKQLN